MISSRPLIHQMDRLKQWPIPPFRQLIAIARWRQLASSAAAATSVWDAT